MPQRSKNLIIGAGPAGISTALGLESNYLILERQSDMGGLSGTIEFEGAIFDFGGHSFHTPHPEVRDLVFGAVEMSEQKREARCFSYESLIPYPFQKNFREIKNQGVVDECVQGLDQAQSEPDLSNYENFIINRFGPGISKHFMLPYNRKLWGRDLKRLSADWVGERVAAPEGVKEKFDESGGKRKPLQANTKVAYPAKGGVLGRFLRPCPNGWIKRKSVCRRPLNELIQRRRPYLRIRGSLATKTLFRLYPSMSF